MIHIRSDFFHIECGVGFRSLGLGSGKGDRLTGSARGIHFFMVHQTIGICFGKLGEAGRGAVVTMDRQPGTEDWKSWAGEQEKQVEL